LEDLTDCELFKVADGIPPATLGNGYKKFQLIRGLQLF